jgi:hypothetical protein
MTSFAILLALVAFGPTATTAKEPGGGHSSGGESRGVQQGGGYHADGGTGTRPGAGTNMQRPAGQEMNAHQNVGVQVSPQFPVGVGASGASDSWRYRSDNGRWWYWTPQNRWMWYGDNGQWTDYSANMYVVQRPILDNFSGSPITITNPATNGVSLNYTLDGVAYTIAPGSSQDFREDRAWVVQFSRGGNLDQARYGLTSGLYSFTGTEHGWELYKR